MKTFLKFTVLLIFHGMSAEFIADSHTVLTTIESLVMYYKENYMLMNLDGIYGLRLLQGLCISA